MEIKTTLILDSSESLSRVLPQLDETPAVIITKEGKYCGIIDHRCISQGIRDPHNVKCETVLTKPPVLLESTGILERVSAFLGGHFKALPVLDAKERPLGITTRVELLKEMKLSNLIPNFAVSEIMSSPVYTVDENETIATVKNTLKEKKTHRLAVTKRGEIVGIVSAFDITSLSTKANQQGGRKDIHEPVGVDEMKISSFLRPDVTRVKEDSSLGEAAARMIEKQVSTVIVVADNKPLGVISALDIFKKVQDMTKEGVMIQISGLDGETSGQYNHIQTKVSHILEKFSKSFNIRNCSVHVKSGKATYTVSIYFDTDNGHVSLKCERASLQEGVDELAAEINNVLRKKKEIRNLKPRVTHAE